LAANTQRLLEQIGWHYARGNLLPLTCSVLTIRHLIRFLPTPLPVHPDNLQPSGEASESTYSITSKITTIQERSADVSPGTRWRNVRVPAGRTPALRGFGL